MGDKGEREKKKKKKRKKKERFLSLFFRVVFVLPRALKPRR